ncbi:G-protein coupled receptor family C group 6 member A-like [Phyllopteryx taeniolatus]|uniref:G-protein coupled receptor family C group 6 member A-like n=1 Tax=Phyllopteryx taeniolatus TaxID=161469 RepID=UPI002AD450DE|nr:G-protein coupled receptor family C group 6 member A-like [Phyllopteryx taeniolatus]
MFFFSAVVSIMAVLSSEESNALLNAYLPGDIIIGGLFPIHLQTNRSTIPGPVSCSHYSYQMFLQSQVMIYAIRDVNQRTPRLLPNITLGYSIYDTCGDVTFATKATLELASDWPDPQRCLLPPNARFVQPQVMAVIGERFSEVSIAVSRIVALSSLAQISYASTSGLLSRKLKFPTFLRTISSDEYQTKAIAELVKQFNWKTVAIIGSDDEYGKYGSDRLSQNFRKIKDICIEFVDILPGYFSKNNSKTHERLAGLVRNVNKSTAEAIVIFTKGSNVDIIMEAAIKYKLNRTWIASDSWSTSTTLATLPGIEMAGQVFGFNSNRNAVPGFKDYIMSVFNGTTNAILDYHRTHYPFCSNWSGEDSGADCILANSIKVTGQCVDIKCLANHMDEDETYNIYLAVQVIVEGIRRLLQCDHQKCDRHADFTALELLMEIKKVNFTVGKTHLFFDSCGDPSLGYDILYWDTAAKTLHEHIQIIGGYWPNGNIAVPHDMVLKMQSVTLTAYNCSKTCKPGHELKKQNVHLQCCNDCVPCAEGEYSTGQGTECKRCRDNEYSSPQRNECLEKKIDFLGWSDPFIIMLAFLEALGIILTLVFAALFAIHRGTPIVKAVGGSLCFLELFSLLTCFCLTFSFPGKPSALSCMIGMPLFGIAFSLCISCILANLLQILVGFMFDLKTKSWLNKVNRPVAVVAVVSGIQLALCVPWLCLYPPSPTCKSLQSTILLQCHKGSSEFFIAMLAYNALLALICFLFAFKGKQLPDLYKNASLITVSMLLYLIIWILFIPIYINLFGTYKQAIESAAILISSYSILCCHLAPKCYIMVFKKEMNDEKAIVEYIRKHYEGKGISVVK